VLRTGSKRGYPCLGKGSLDEPSRGGASFYRPRRKGTPRCLVRCADTKYLVLGTQLGALQGLASAQTTADGLVETAALLDRLMGYDGVRTALRSGSNDANAGPVLAMHFRKQDTSLRLFTTIAMLGTPQDITLQELRIECFFPLDDATADLLRSWAKVP
jgi:MmyB-like transcription regulator ligand binding domain